MLFSDLRLAPAIVEAAHSEGYTKATPIQAQAIPQVLAGKDVLGCAQTGTGKTAAFAMPILHLLSTNAPAAAARQNAVRRPRCLVLSPTRELAVQIAESFATYGKNTKFRTTTIFGGVSQHWQVDALRRGIDIVVATPGRLMDLMEQRHVDLGGIEMLVLDESDRMLDMGFIQPIRRIVSKIPEGRQTLMFSATMPTEIRKLADSLLRNPSVINVAPVATVASQIEESVYHIERNGKADLLAHLVKSLPMYRTIVFTRTKHGADRVVRHLQTRGIRAEAIHGNKTQNARQRALSNFSNNKVPVLVATDIASRGIDVDGITHVVNYDLTHEPETYVHRIGRTARAGASGAAISFCDRDERSNLRAIERLVKRTIPTIANPLPPSTAESRGEAEEDPATRVPASHRRDTQRPENARHQRGPHEYPSRSNEGGNNRRQGGSNGERRPQGGQGGDRRPQPQGAQNGDRRPQSPQGGNGDRRPQSNEQRPQNASAGERRPQNAQGGDRRPQNGGNEGRANKPQGGRSFKPARPNSAGGKAAHALVHSGKPRPHGAGKPASRPTNRQGGKGVARGR